MRPPPYPVAVDPKAAPVAAGGVELIEAGFSVPDNTGEDRGVANDAGAPPPPGWFAAFNQWWRAPAIGGTPVSRRALAFVIVLLVHILLALALMLITPKAPPKFGDPANVFTLLPDRPPAPKPAPRPAAKPAPKAAAKTKPIKPVNLPKAPAPKVVVQSPPTPDSKPFTVQLFDAIDIAKLPNHKAELAQADSASADTGTGSGSSIGDSSFVQGGGPNGERLYNAEWQREPTDAELAFYLPKTGVASGSYALIACRTAPRYKVEDCVEQGEGPRGSGLARHIVDAAWQFRVLPPRVGGKALIGSWVRILISFGKDDDGKGSTPFEGANLPSRQSRSQKPGDKTYGPSP
jgi:hypothetical protein